MFFSLKRKKNKPAEIYMDHASGTAISPSILNKMKPYFVEQFYNPSALYSQAVAVKTVISGSRKKVADILGVSSKEVFFVDGATEANNIAILGTLKSFQKEHPKETPHIITSSIEHASILQVIQELEEQGHARVSYLDVDENGYVNHKQLRELLAADTLLVSIGYVNGEIGTIQDIRAIAKTIRNYRKVHKTMYPYFHTDAVQAANYCSVSIPQLGIDMMSLNASKIYGPKKSGMLYVQNKISMQPVFYGGGQEQGMRPGTENVSAIVGMAEALSETQDIMDEEAQRLGMLQLYMIASLKESIPHVIFNALAAKRIPNIVNITLPHLSHEEIVLRLDAKGIMASVKSACKAGEDGDSHVIKAIAKSNRSTGSIRFSMGRETTKKNIDKVVIQMVQIVKNMNETFEKYYTNM